MNMELQNGDLVRIREWDDMVDEFGIDSMGDIKSDPYFVVGMRELCGREFVVENFNEYIFRCKDVSTGRFVGGEYCCPWHFSLDMVAEITPHGNTNTKVKTDFDVRNVTDFFNGLEGA